MMKFLIFCAGILLAGCGASKKLPTVITEDYVQRIESALSHDSMQGRQVFTPGADRAASFIAGEMEQIGLQTFANAPGYYQPFVLRKMVDISGDVSINRNSVPTSNVICFSADSSLNFTEHDNYKVERVMQGDNFRDKMNDILDRDENLLVLIDSSFGSIFQRIRRYQIPMERGSNNKVFVLTPDPAAANFTVDLRLTTQPLPAANVVGLLPGKSRPGEYVVFSAHYDHLGIGRADEKGDSLYNGANDDASGVAAVLALARHFKALDNNERSIIFATFTAEEIGVVGSGHFSKQIDPASIVAMFNIEMIGTDSKWGNNSAYITGYEKSDLGKILSANVDSSRFKYYPDPYVAQQLFYRSDNAWLAKKGVPAHTISTSKMDNEPHYHKPGDEIGTLDMKNMTAVIKAIAQSARSIISGQDTPTRVDPLEVKYKR